MSTTTGIPTARIDFSSDQEVRWCPGCGDYSILKQVQTLLEQGGRKKEEVVEEWDEVVQAQLERIDPLRLEEAGQHTFSFSLSLSVSLLLLS
ncbi:MAG: hypothetical protein ACK4L7_12395, partial [Flavobacteriales bacterium]